MVDGYGAADPSPGIFYEGNIGTNTHGKYEIIKINPCSALHKDGIFVEFNRRVPEIKGNALVLKNMLHIFCTFFVQNA